MLTDVGAGAAIVLTEAVPVREGETVFVPAAAGGLGSFAVQIAMALGATVMGGAGTNAERDVALEVKGPGHYGRTLPILAPFGRLVSYGSIDGKDAGFDEEALKRALPSPAPSQQLTGFNAVLVP